MKIAGKILIGTGLFLFGLVKWYIPLCFIIGGIAAIDLDNHYKF